VVIALSGEIDFSSDSIPREKIKLLYENDFPYLERTAKGKSELYSIKPVNENSGSGRKNSRLKKCNSFSFHA